MKWLKFRLSKSFADVEEEFLEEARKEKALKEAQRKPECRLGTSSSGE